MFEGIIYIKGDGMQTSITEKIYSGNSPSGRNPTMKRPNRYDPTCSYRSFIK